MIYLEVIFKSNSNDYSFMLSSSYNIYINFNNIITMAEIPAKFLDPNTYYNHGDNPAMKKFIQIGM